MLTTIITLLAFIFFIIACALAFRLWHLGMEHEELQSEHSKLLLKLTPPTLREEKPDIVLNSEDHGPRPAPLSIISGQPYVNYVFRALWDAQIQRLQNMDGMHVINVDCPHCGVISLACTYFPKLHGQGDCCGCGRTLHFNNGKITEATAVA